MKAFPNVSNQQGMDLRDYFAARAMQVFMCERNDHGEHRWEPVDIAELSYELADAMMKERGNNHG
jgi:hypothetical protein